MRWYGHVRRPSINANKRTMVTMSWKMRGESRNADFGSLWLIEAVP